MDALDRLLNIVMLVSTIAMFVKGWLSGMDLFDLIFNNVYLLTLLLYLIKKNFLDTEE
jgi:hypothetical protein